MRGWIAVLMAVGVADGALAQDEKREGWSLNIGAGALVAPTYDGDDDYRLSLLPNVQLSYGDSFFASVQEGVGYRWINTDELKAGPIGRIKFSRDEDGDQTFAVTGEDTDDLRGLGDVDTSIELGGFIDYEIGALTLGFEARQAVSGHDGFVVDVDARWSGRSMAFGPPIFWSVGPRAKFVGESYNEAYFGVTPAQSLASGLPVYDADGGLHSYGLGASAVYPLTRDRAWALVAVAGYDRLAGDAESSPLVRERGSPDQLSVGLFLSHRLF